MYVRCVNTTPFQEVITHDINNNNQKAETEDIQVILKYQTSILRNFTLCGTGVVNVIHLINTCYFYYAFYISVHFAFTRKGLWV